MILSDKKGMLSFGRSLTEQGFSKLSVGASVEDPAYIDSKSKHLDSFKSAHFFQPASKVHILNVKAGGDVIGSIQTYLSSNKIEAANVMSAVGTLRSVTMRLAYCNEGKGYPTRTHHGKKQKYQLISLSGCLSMHGARLSVCIGDSSGTSHVGQLMGNMIAHDQVEICAQPHSAKIDFFCIFILDQVCLKLRVHALNGRKGKLRFRNCKSPKCHQPLIKEQIHHPDVAPSHHQEHLPQH